MKRWLVAMTVLAVLGSPGFVLAQSETPAGDAQKAPSKKKKKKKKKAKASQSPVDLGNLDEEPVDQGPAVAPPEPTSPPPVETMDSPPPAPSGDDATKASAASDPADAKPSSSTTGSGIEVAILGGFGLNGASCGTASCNAYGVGIGLRGGLKISDQFFVGGSATYHVGASPEVPVRPFTSKYNISISYFGAEAGYTFPVAPVTIRPYLGAGLAVYTATVVKDFSAQKGTPEDLGGGVRLALWPGLSVAYPVGQSFFVSSDLRLAVVPGAENAASLFLGAGLTL